LSKLALAAGSAAGELWERRMRACGRGWCEPILVGGLTYIGRHRDLYSFVVGPILVAPLTYIGRYYLPHGGSGGASGGGAEDGHEAVPSGQLSKTR